MKKTLIPIAVIMLTFLVNGCQSDEFIKISEVELRNKIAGGWAGKMIGVSYGAPTEFNYNGVINEDPINWNIASLRNSIGQDDLYVQMSFMMTMDEYGIDAPVENFGEAFANAGYMLWHANRGARMNIWNGIMPPASGHPDHNLHADDIDFQIEADYIGLMCPAMPQTSNEICDKIGHIMNYGDGVYGGMFVSALYAAAYFEEDVKEVLLTSMKSLPEESQYYQILDDVVEGYKRNPDDWKKTWREIYDKWGEADICCALSEFNIDAKLNGAFIAMGLLYGEGDFEKTLEISTRCGADSDCNPSNCGGVLGIILGYDNIPSEWTRYIDEIADSLFIYTDYSFNIAVDRTLYYAKELIVANGGKVVDGICYIKAQEPVPATLEVSFPNMIAKEKVTIDDKAHWELKGNWKTVQQADNWGEFEKQMQADETGSELIFNFNGTGAVVMGRFDMDCGIIDIYVDDEFVKSKDNYYKVEGMGAGDGWLNGAHLAHALDLEPGDHSIKLVVKGEKNEKSTGTKLKVSRAIIYDSEPEKTRVLLDTDANNELDDQHAIAYMLFNGDYFNVEGITVNKTSNGGDVDQHYAEAERVVKLCDLHNRIPIYKGANGTFEEIKDHVNEAEFDGMDAVNFIIERAHAESDSKLVLLPVGKLTNIALALEKDPSIADKVRIVWLGSNYPDPGEYNQVNDLSAVQYLLDARVNFEIVMVRYDKPSGTDAVRALLSDIEERMPGLGPAIDDPVTGRHGNEFTNFGDYSVSLFENIEEYHGDPPSRALFDMAAVAIVKNASWAEPRMIPSPKLINGNWIERPDNARKITIWENFDKESILGDFYDCLENYVLAGPVQ
ncbi:ADP-ribosylglycohydrolase family protein [Bacteroidota bacterium]